MKGTGMMYNDMNAPEDERKANVFCIASLIIDDFYNNRIAG